MNKFSKAKDFLASSPEQAKDILTNNKELLSNYDEEKYGELLNQAKKGFSGQKCIEIQKLIESSPRQAKSILKKHQSLLSSFNPEEFQKLLNDVEAVIDKIERDEALREKVATLEKERKERKTAEYFRKEKEKVDKLGFSERDLREIYFEDIGVEERINKEVEERYPINQYLYTGDVVDILTEPKPGWAGVTVIVPKTHPGRPRLIKTSFVIPVGGSFKVLDTFLDGSCWYYGEARSDVSILGKGWVISDALWGEIGDFYERNRKNRYGLWTELESKYRKKLARKYGITRGELKDISHYIFSKSWKAKPKALSPVK